jgi:flavin-dependent thymidylate synthase
MAGSTLMAPVVRLAGYNLDADLIREVLDFLRMVEHEHGSAGFSGHGAADLRPILDAWAARVRGGLSPEAFTPETISAAYARISRDPKPVTELRKAARQGVSRSRKSNENIIFGLGHASVAEHACFNFDILGLSRLASEELQSHRLVSFTEKSQRYISLTTDYVVPPELVGTSWEKTFHDVLPCVFSDYQNLTRTLSEHFAASLPAPRTPDNLRDLETRAKEDARYVLPLACTTQMGATMNARSVEHVVSELSDHSLEECRLLGKALNDAVRDLAPSLVKYTKRQSFPRTNRTTITQQFAAQSGAQVEQNKAQPTVRLINESASDERDMLRALAFSSGRIRTIEAWKALGPQQEALLWKEVFRGMTEHDSPLREFEMATLTCEVSLSASCFAQLKRHRLMTLLPQPYLINDDVIIPPTIAAAGLDGAFRKTVDALHKAARDLAVEHPALAPYLLPNAQRRCVLLHLNARELYHVVRLRCDAHAQWEIRALSDQLLSLAKKLWPNLLRLACGKDQFGRAYAAEYDSSA